MCGTLRAYPIYYIYSVDPLGLGVSQIKVPEEAKGTDQEQQLRALNNSRTRAWMRERRKTAMSVGMFLTSCPGAWQWQQ